MNDDVIGFAFTGSFCTFSRAIKALEVICQKYSHVIPILSETSWRTDTRFGPAALHADRIAQLTGQLPLHTIEQVEPIGPRKMLDVLVIAPCTGNTLAKLSHGIADTPVTMAAKSHLRNGRPVVLAVSTNDGLGAAAENIGGLMRAKHIYFVPFRQDAPVEKPTSLVADFDLLPPAVDAALVGKQLQPILLGPNA